MTRFLTIASVATVLTLSSAAFAGPSTDRPPFRGAYTRAQVNKVEKSYALTGQTNDRSEREVRFVGPRNSTRVITYRNAAN